MEEEEDEEREEDNDISVKEDPILGSGEFNQWKNVAKANITILKLCLRKS